MSLDEPNGLSSPPNENTLLPRAVTRVPPVGLVMTDVQFDQILGHLRATLPQEGCGLIAIARQHPKASLTTPQRVVHFYPGTNIDHSPTRYTMNPAEVLSALRDMEAKNWRLGAIVHSHPVSPPTPSRTDLREAHYQGALMIIVSFSKSEPEMRAWTIHTDVNSPESPFQEASLLIEETVTQLCPTSEHSR